MQNYNRYTNEETSGQVIKEKELATGTKDKIKLGIEINWGADKSKEGIVFVNVN